MFRGVLISLKNWNVLLHFQNWYVMFYFCRLKVESVSSVMRKKTQIFGKLSTHRPVTKRLRVFFSIEESVYLRSELKTFESWAFLPQLSIQCICILAINQDFQHLKNHKIESLENKYSRKKNGRNIWQCQPITVFFHKSTSSNSWLTVLMLYKFQTLESQLFRTCAQVVRVLIWTCWCRASDGI